MKSRKRETREGIKQANKESIRTLEENENYMSIGILKAENIKQVKIKQIIKKKFFGRTRKLLETKRCSRNLIKEINLGRAPLMRYSGLFLKWPRKELRQIDQRTSNLIKEINLWAVPLIRYPELFFKWIRKELSQMDQRTRKFMTMQKALNPSDVIDLLYVSRKEGGRGLTFNENYSDVWISVEVYIKKKYDLSKSLGT